MTQLFFQSFCTKKAKNFYTKRWLQNGQNNFYTTKTLLSKNGLRIAVGGLVKLLEKCFFYLKKALQVNLWVLMWTTQQID